jgi:hypothetical protein
MNRDVHQAVASSRLFTLLDELETALPALTRAPSLPATDWHDLGRRLSGLRALLGSGKDEGRPRRADSVSRRKAAVATTSATLF